MLIHVSERGPRAQPRKTSRVFAILVVDSELKLRVVIHPSPISNRQKLFHAISRPSRLHMRHLIWIRDPFYKVCELIILKNSSYSYLRNNRLIRSQLCTCHDSWAVVACPNVWSYCIIRIIINHNNSNENVLKISIPSSRTLGEMVPGTLALSTCIMAALSSIIARWAEPAVCLLSKHDIPMPQVCIHSI